MKAMTLSTAALMVMSSLAGQGTTLLEDHFDSYTEGSTLSGQGGWTLDPVDWGTNDSVVGTAYGRYDSASSKGFRVDDFDSGVDSSFMIHAFPSQTVGIVQFDFNAFVGSRGDNRTRIFVRDDTAGGVAGAQLGLSGTSGVVIQFGSGIAGTVTADADPFWWYQLRMVFDLDADTVTASYKRDDAVTYTVLATAAAITPGFEMSELILHAQQRGDLPVLPNGAAGFLDDIVVTNNFVIPEPGTASLLILAAILVGAWRRCTMRV